MKALRKGKPPGREEGSMCGGREVEDAASKVLLIAVMEKGSGSDFGVGESVPSEVSRLDLGLAML